MGACETCLAIGAGLAIGEYTMDWVPVWLLLFKGGVLFTGMFYAIKWHYDQDRQGQNADGAAQWTQDMRLFVALLVALTLALSGIVVAGCWGSAADGGWGGAAAFVLMLGVYFAAKPMVVAGPQEQARQAAAFRQEKACFGAGIILSTLAWKYGAVAAGWFAFVR